jgi:radical SAM superfamily enzyme YgiQ (UPF0313 family)
MVPSYFNAGHHLPVFQVGQYLRETIGAEVKCIDAAALNYTWRDVCVLLAQPYDAICVMNDLDGIDGFARFVHYARDLAPRARLITFGRLSGYIPGFFERYGFDAIAYAGDYEAAVAAVLQSADRSAVPGVAVLKDGSYVYTPGAITLSADHWTFPDVREIPYSAYDSMYRDDLKKFCGIPDRRELVVPVARGCPINCQYCDVPKLQGRKERRVDVDRVLDYIEESLRVAEFEYVSFYAPTFTLNRRWVLDLCEKKRDRGIDIPWKCVTTLSHIDSDLLTEMAKAKCVRVSIGLETLDPTVSHLLPKAKQDVEERLRRLLDDCARTGVELNCFVMLGMPGESPEGIQHTIETVRNAGARVRPTVYTPYQELRADMTELEVSMLNRQLVFDADEVNKDLVYDLLYRNSRDVPTPTTHRIPVRLKRKGVVAV